MTSKYNLVTADSRERLITDVNAALADGWVLSGGVACSSYSMHVGFDTYGEKALAITIEYHQAVFKPDEKE